MTTTPLAGKTILLIETNSQIRQTLAGMLRQCGVRDVLIAQGARAALEMLGQPVPKIDLLLCGFALDQSNGLGLVRAVRCGIGKAPRAIPCALVADKSDDKLKALAGKLDIGFVFSLPIAPNQLAAALGTVLRNAVPTRPADIYKQASIEWAPAGPAPIAEAPQELTAREAALAESRAKSAAAEIRVEASAIAEPVTLARDLRNGKGMMLVKANEMVTPKAISRLIEQGAIGANETVFVAVASD